MKSDVLDTYDIVSKDYGYNSNSLHKLGIDAKKIENAATELILEVLNLEGYDVIYTSGNAESFTTIINNIKGNVVTDNDSFYDICKDLFVSVSKDIESINDETFISVRNPLFVNKKINHIDLNLSLKYDNLNSYDYITIEDDIPGIGVLIKRKNINFDNLIHGGKSTTKFRAGTSNVPMIVSFAKLIKLKYKKG